MLITNGDGECMTKRAPENVEKNFTDLIRIEIPKDKIFNGNVKLISVPIRETIAIGMMKKLINGITKMFAGMLLRVN